MPAPSKLRLKHLLDSRSHSPNSVGHRMAGTVKILGDIAGPTWTEPWDAELGIAYHGDNGPVYWVRGELSEMDDQ